MNIIFFIFDNIIDNIYFEFIITEIDDEDIDKIQIDFGKK